MKTLTKLQEEYCQKMWFRYCDVIQDPHPLKLCPVEFRKVFERYSEPHRFFHTFKHVEHLWDLVDKWQLSHRRLYYAAALFHDVVYIPGAKDNEAKSVDVMLSTFNTNREMKWVDPKAIDIYNKVIGMIMATKTHELADCTDPNLDGPFITMDLEGLVNNTDIISDELTIFKEFQKYSVSDWRKGRLQFLQNCHHKNTDAVKNRIEFVKNFKPKIGVFCGTFNKFHIGHMNILEKAEQVFDKVIVVTAINPEKKQSTSNAQLFEVLPFHQVIEHNGFLTELVKKLQEQGCQVSIVKGFRNGQDISYEMQLLRFMQDQLPEVSVIYIPCDSEYEHISSSMLKSITAFGATDAPYLPTKYVYQ